MKKTVFVLLLAFSSFATAENKKSDYRAFDTPVNYNFGEFSLGTVTYDDLDVDATFISGGGESMLTEQLILSTYFSGLSIDEPNVSVSSNQFVVKLLMRVPTGDSTDIVFGGGLGYYWMEATSGLYRATDNDLGINASLGLRHGFTERFEGGLEASMSNAYGETELILSGNIAYYFNNHFGLGLRYMKLVDDDVSASGAALQLRFRF